ncbi:SRPBCC family protein [Notoacmeibacter sp. MSK16QG-6]|uniref:SRPBCC family protein n=1 Tax=Notoacmeibacter sp. MSK16QG-6 TaxID=2957982 RepID=UPI00209DE299|nr:SRPBCC family protein [Notoacmeibacter sp. MSK16QG-6]MCP1200653.1 SRPBCC family protein [Notoacmeibacter sp. MSK16QG-6]
MRLFRFFLLAISLTFPAIGYAHGPTRQKVTLSVDVSASPSDVWAVIGDFQDMSWHPAVFSTTGEGGNTIDATRKLTLNEEGGPVISEVLYKYDPDKMTYSYRITDVDVEVLPVTNYSSHLTVKPNEGGGSHIEWRGAFYRGYPNNDPPENLNDEAALAAVSAVYQAGLDALAERFGQ